MNGKMITEWNIIMDVSPEQVEVIVSRVMERLSTGGGKPRSCQSAGNTIGEKPGIFETIDRAVLAAGEAFARLCLFTLTDRQRFIEAIRETCRRHVLELARELEHETGLGRAEDKVKKLSLVIEKTPGIEDLDPQVFTGDHGLTLVERAPFGVLGAITPVTNPVETIICNTICFIAGGNAAVFNPHPNSKTVCAHAVALINRAVLEAGGPENLITTVGEPTIETGQELMKHPDVRLLVVTGGPGLVQAAMQSGKRVIAAGPGNPPVVVDETADIPKAALDIVNGASLDNNIICVLEKEIIAVDSIADQLKAEMKKHGTVELQSHQIRQMEKAVIKNGSPNKALIGKNAGVLLSEIGVAAEKNVRLILAEVPEEHPFVQLELMMPLIGLVRVKCVDAAIAAAVRCEHGFRHTAVMHSRHIGNLSKMAKVINTTIFVKNASSFAGLGEGGEGYTSYTIAGATGEGLTTPRTFTRERRCTLKDYFRIV